MLDNMLVQLDKENIGMGVESQTCRLSFLMNRISDNQINQIIKKDRLEKEKVVEHQEKIMALQQCNKYLQLKPVSDTDKNEGCEPLEKTDWKRLHLVKQKKTVKIVVPEEEDLETKKDENPVMFLSLGDLFSGPKSTEDNCDTDIVMNADSPTEEMDIRIGSEEMVEEKYPWLAEMRWSKGQEKTCESLSTLSNLKRKLRKR